MENNKFPETPTKVEFVFADYDVEHQIFGVFGINSGFCYSSWPSLEVAEIEAIDQNASNLRVGNL